SKHSTKASAYSIRLNRKSAKDKRLIELPHVIQELLPAGFAEDLGGHGQDELRVGVAVDLSDSVYYMSLGKSKEESDETLKRIKDRLELRSEAFSALQKALKDERGYSYGNLNGNFTWIPSSKKAKRRRVALEEDDEEENYGRIAKFATAEDSNGFLNVET
ncbi:hypothetical protein ANCCAN_09438, partial [Ancylostoma caninum]